MTLATLILGMAVIDESANCTTEQGHTHHTLTVSTTKVRMIHVTHKRVYVMHTHTHTHAHTHTHTHAHTRAHTQTLTHKQLYSWLCPSAL